MMSYPEGSHVMFLRFTWSPYGIRPDLAIKNAKEFFMAQPILVIPDGQLVCVEETHGLRVFEYVVDLENKINLETMNTLDMFLDFIDGRFQVKDRGGMDKVIISALGPFGDLTLSINQDGFLSVLVEEDESRGSLFPDYLPVT